MLQDDDQENDDGDEGIGRELLATSDSDPEEALEWISHLTEEGLPEHPTVLFSKFNALRHLATDRLHEAGISFTGSKSPDEIAPYFGAQERDYARDALRMIAKLETVDPEYLREHDFIAAFIDRVAAPLERISPHSVQEILGWTKLSYFGFDRIRFFGNLIKEIPADLSRSILGARIRTGRKATSAIAVRSARDPEFGRFVEFLMLERDPAEGETISDVLTGTLRVFEGGEMEFIPD